VTNRKTEVLGAALLGASGAASIYSLGPKNTKTDRIQKRKKKQSKKIKESKAKVDKAKLSFAKEDLKRLEKIKNSDLSKSNIKVKNELIKKQKDIIKKGTSNTLKDIAKKIGLRAIPGAGAFIAAFSSSPAGKGSDFKPREKKISFDGKLRKK
jgi:hypothetical protein|tara:strand:+ start:72 stop:530 length:459 start_codon:yes stop_codon:yes gene_type:complete